MMFWYYKLLALHPKWIAFVALALSSVCIFIALEFEELPDFTDPALVSVQVLLYSKTKSNTKSNSHMRNVIVQRIVCI